jgi:DNA-binding NarL/FixJ family response regulator
VEKVFMKVFIVEDYESMRIILKRLLKKNFNNITAIGESETAEEALEEIPKFNPELVLVDISLPGMDGIELIRRVVKKCKTICVLVVTAHDIEFYQDKAIEAGAHGIVSKTDFEELIDMVGILMKKSKEGGC